MDSYKKERLMMFAGDEVAKNALSGSIEKWTNIVDGTSSDKATLNCTLCQTYHCDNCPVGVLGFKECSNIQYFDWRKHWRTEHKPFMNENDPRVVCNDCKIFASRELEFLSDILKDIEEIELQLEEKEREKEKTFYEQGQMFKRDNYGTYEYYILAAGRGCQLGLVGLTGDIGNRAVDFVTVNDHAHITQDEFDAMCGSWQGEFTEVINPIIDVNEYAY